MANGGQDGVIIKVHADDEKKGNPLSNNPQYAILPEHNSYVQINREK